jgi:lipoprotein-anchoring transpeptidase ErfK/SrfK
MNLKRRLCSAAVLVCCAPALALADPQTPPALVETPQVAATVAVPPTDRTPVAAAKPVAAPKPAITLHAKADLAQQTLTVSERGRVVGVWKISSGTEDHATPRGIFQPEWTSKMWYSQTYDNAPMPHAVFFKSGAAIHATQAVGALGRAASHGCVRLAPANAETFYKLVQRHGLSHTRITVFGTPVYAPRPVAARREMPALQRSAAAPLRQAALQPVAGAPATRTAATGQASQMPWTGPRNAPVRTAHTASGSVFATVPSRAFYPPVRYY